MKHLQLVTSFKFLKKKGVDIMNTVYSSKKIGKRLSKIIFLLSLIIFIGFVTPNGEVVAAEVPRLSRIGFTSDIHANTADLKTWLNGLKSSGTPSLNHFVDRKSVV